MTNTGGHIHQSDDWKPDEYPDLAEAAPRRTRDPFGVLVARFNRAARAEGLDAGWHRATGDLLLGSPDVPIDRLVGLRDRLVKDLLQEWER